MNFQRKSGHILYLFLLMPFIGKSQFIVSGTVLDNTRTNYVEGVKVISSGGIFALTDSMGHYAIMVNDTDTLSFVYNKKSTQKFPVASITTPQAFDISLRIAVPGKYKVLKEVIVFSKSYKEDSAENRQLYADIFDYEKPGISTSISPGGVAGADLDELINIFRFKRNRQLLAFQERLREQEEQKFIDSRFNRKSVGRITGLRDEMLDTFLVHYRPNYEFTRFSDEVTFNQYILEASYQFKDLMRLSPGMKSAGKSE